MQITIQDPIAHEIEKRVQESADFTSAEDYVNYVLEQVIAQTSQESEGAAYSKDEEQVVKQRLEDLGYLE